jgi:hypothetical protein
MIGRLPDDRDLRRLQWIDSRKKPPAPAVRRRQAANAVGECGKDGAFIWAFRIPAASARGETTAARTHNGEHVVRES